MNIQRSGNWLKSMFEKPLSKAVAAVGGLMQQPARKGDDRVGDAVIDLMKAVIWANGKPGERAINEFRDSAEKFIPPRKMKTLLNDLTGSEPINIEDVASALNEVDYEEKLRVIRVLIALAMSSHGLSEEQRRLIGRIADSLQIESTTLHDALDETVKTEQSRRRLIRSGAGIAVALIVIFVFILTATLLKSVIFGLILAYFFLPLEKWYEKQLAGNKLIVRMLSFPDRLLKPLGRLPRLMGQQPTRGGTSEEAMVRHRKHQRVSRATALTVSTVVIVLLALGVVFFQLSASYLENVGKSITSWVRQHERGIPEATDDATEKTEASARVPLPTDTQTTPAPHEQSVGEDYGFAILRNMITELETLKPKFQKLPAVAWGINQVSLLLNDPATQREVITLLLKKTGGVFAFAAGLVSLLVTLLLNILLTFFFFSLFLGKMAVFCDDDDKSSDIGGYLVGTIFNGKWLPDTDKNTAREAQRIIAEVVNKLTTWLKGYGTLVLLDMVLYSSVFYLLGVPYWLPLGLVAGCGILLPYIGAVSSAVLTIIVALAAGGDSVTMLQIVGIVGFYVFYNAIVEQFFLYPRIIGDSLGLSTLETIIVVLLGGIFAGITGMIFAIPTAAVLKYLVPQIYLLNKSEDTI